MASVASEVSDLRSPYIEELAINLKSRSQTALEADYEVVASVSVASVSWNFREILPCFCRNLPLSNDDKFSDFLDREWSYVSFALLIQT